MFYPLSVLSAITVPADVNSRSIRLSCNGESFFTNTYQLTEEFRVYGLDEIIRQYMHDNSLVTATVTVHIIAGTTTLTQTSYNIICTGREFDGDNFDKSFLLDCNYLEIPFLNLGNAPAGVAVACNEASLCTLATYTDDDVTSSNVNVSPGVSVIAVQTPAKLPAMVAVTCGDRSAYLTFLSALQTYNRVILRWRNTYNVPVMDSFPAKITKNPQKLENPVRVGGKLQAVGLSESPDYTIDIAEITYDRAVAMLALAESLEVELLVPEPVRFSTQTVDIPLNYKARRIVVKSIDGNISNSRTEKPSLSINFAYTD